MTEIFVYAKHAQQRQTVKFTVPNCVSGPMGLEQNTDDFFYSLSLLSSLSLSFSLFLWLSLFPDFLSSCPEGSDTKYAKEVLIVADGADEVGGRLEEGNFLTKPVLREGPLSPATGTGTVDISSAPDLLTPDFLNLNDTTSFMDVLMDSSVLKSDEYAYLSAMANTETVVEVNHRLMNCVRLKGETLRWKFMDLLAKHQARLPSLSNRKRGNGSRVGAHMLDRQVFQALGSSLEQSLKTSPAKDSSVVSEPVEAASAVPDESIDSQYARAPGTVHGATTDSSSSRRASTAHDASSDRSDQPVWSYHDTSSIASSKGAVHSHRASTGNHSAQSTRENQDSSAESQPARAASATLTQSNDNPPASSSSAGHSSSDAGSLFSARDAAHTSESLPRSNSSPGTAYRPAAEAAMSGQRPHSHSDVGERQQGLSSETVAESAAEKARPTHVDWVKLLDNISGEIGSFGECVSLATQLGLGENRPSDIVHKLRHRYSDEWHLVGGELFRMWLRLPASPSRKMDDVGKERFLHDVFLYGMRHRQLMLRMNELLPIFHVGGPPLQASQQGTHGRFRPWAPYLRRPTPAVRKYLKRLVKQAEKLSASKAIDFYSGDDSERIEDVHVCVTSMSYYKASFNFLEQQRKGSPEQLAGFACRSMADSSGARELKNLEELLKREKDQLPINRCLVLGGGGAGKSILCRKIAHDWKSEKDVGGFKKFDAVVYLEGREVVRAMADSEVQFLGIGKRNDPDECDEIVTFLTEHAEVLFVIDGVDQLGGRLEEGKILNELLRGEGPFSTASVIITSRPSANVYSTLETWKIQRIISLVGLKDLQLRELASKRLTDQQASRFQAEISVPFRAEVKSMAQETPLVAAMLIRQFSSDDKLPLSISDLYRWVFASVLQRNALRIVERNTNRRLGKQTPPQGSAFPLEYLENHSRVTEILTFAAGNLSELALEGLKNGQFVFTRREVAVFCQQDSEEVGLLKVMVDPGSPIGEQMHSFIHLSWQEFLAAQELANSKKFAESLANALLAIGCGKHTWLFWRFVAGLLPCSLLPELILQLSMCMNGLEKSLSGKRKRFFLLTCLAERQEPTTSTHVSLATNVLFPDKAIDFGEYPTQLYELSALTFAVKRMQHLGSIRLDHCGLQADQIRMIAPTLHQFISISLSNNEISGQGLLHLAKGLTSYTPQLRAISLTHCSLTDEDVPALSALINGSPFIEKLMLSWNQFGPGGVCTFFEGICHGSPCQDVDLSYNNLKGLDGTETGRAICKLTKLQVLDLTGCKLTDSSVEALFAELHPLNLLQSLVLKSNELTEAIFPPIGAFFFHRHSSPSYSTGPTPSFQRASPLQVFITENDFICSMDIQSAVACGAFPADSPDSLVFGVQEVFRGKITRRALEASMIASDHAEFYFYGIGDDSVEEITNALSSSPAVTMTKSVNLKKNKIGDKGAMGLASSLTRNVSLKGLSLSENEVQTTGASMLANCLSWHNSTLTHLDLSHNPIFQVDGEPSNACFETLLCDCNSLKGLLLENTGLTDYHCELFRARRCFGNSLMLLSLSDNSIGDAGVALLAGPIAHTSTLWYVSLSSNHLTDMGARVLADEISSPSSLCQDLKFLWVGGNSISGTFFDNCPCGNFAPVMGSFIDYQLKYILEEYLLGPSEILSSVKHQTASALAFISCPELVEIIEECVAINDVQGFNCLVSRALRCLFQTCPSQTKRGTPLDKITDCVCQAYNTSIGTMKSIAGCSFLCVLDEQALNGRGPDDNATERLLYALSELYATTDKSAMDLALDSLVDLCSECGHSDVARLLADQRDLIKAQVLLF